MTIYIFGSSGFIGQNLTSYFSHPSKKYNVIGLEKNQCNLLQPKEIENSLHNLQKEDVIIVTSGITRLLDNTINGFKDNINMIDNLTKVLKDKPFSNLIFLSSIDIYGQQNKDININLHPEPHDYYALSKLSSEFILKNQLQVEPTILRLQGVFGTNDETKSTMYHLVFNALEKRKITLVNKGELKREFLDVENILLVIHDIIQKDKKGTFNLSFNPALKIKDYAKLIQDNLSEKVVIENKSIQENRDYHVNVCEDECLKEFSQLNFYTIEDSIKKYIHSFTIKKKI